VEIVHSVASAENVSAAITLRARNKLFTGNLLRSEK
jgi:hypothetical protein